MPTPTGKPKKGETIDFRFIILGDLELHWRGTVLEWPRYGRVKIRIDEILYAVPRYHKTYKPGDVAVWDEYAAAMYLANGLARVYVDA